MSMGMTREPLDELRNACVLVVDDDPETLSSMRRVLEACGARVVCASSMLEVQALLAGGGAEIEAAMVDLDLDGSRTGREAASIVRALRGAESPCCAGIVTGLHDRGEVGRVVALGIDDVIYKPVDRQTFLRLVHRTVLKTRQLRAQLDEAGRGGEPIGRAPVFLDEPGELSAYAGVPERLNQLARQGALTAQETEVLFQIVLGHTNRQIAEKLSGSERTVKFHVSNILKKLMVPSRNDILRLLIQGGPQNTH